MSLLRQGRFTCTDGRVLGAETHPVPRHGEILFEGEPLDPPQGSVIMLNKPTGYVCSTSDRPPLVYELLPERFLRRSPVVASVGRLDADSSGLLLLTDNGALSHRLTSPRWHLPKTYRVRFAEPLGTEATARLTNGTMLLRGETTPLLPAELEPVDETTVNFTITEGRYHQIRRMFGSIGNHVLELERVSFGPLALNGLPGGSWRVLSEAEVDMLTATPARKPSREVETPVEQTVGELTRRVPQ